MLSQKSDLLILQEALLPEKGLSTYEKSGFSLKHAVSYERADGFKEGVLTCCRAPLSTDPLRVRSLSHEPVFKTPKVALISSYPLGKTAQLTVVNIHALLIRTPNKALLELEHVVSELQRNPDLLKGPVIFAGDFNTFTKQYFSKIETYLGLVGFEHVKIDGDIRKGAGFLDHIFIKDLEILSSCVEDSMISSDHFPIYVQLKTKDLD